MKKFSIFLIILLVAIAGHQGLAEEVQFISQSENIFSKQTYCHDGVLVARLDTVEGLEPVSIALADWDIDNFLGEIIIKLPLNKLLLMLYLLYYSTNCFFKIFLSKTLPKPIKGIIKKILRI